jgi:hypothetical protein
MAVYRFRISFEEFDDIHRDIEIRSNQNFELFHRAIQESIGFDASKPASFYMSNDYWKKGQEMYFDPSNAQPNGKLLMKDARLSDYIADPHQKIYYAFDQPSHWTFFIELFKILPDGDPGKNYPTCVKVHGDAPKQYLKLEAPKEIPDPEFMDDDLFNDLLVNEDDPLEEGTEATSTDEEAPFGDAVDEEEYDNIEESSDEETERE